MGSGTWNPGTYSAYTSTTVGKRTEDIFDKRSMVTDLDPKGVKVRESRDGEDNPESTAIIVGLDVTGSMGMIADNIARKGLGVLFEEILDRKPVTNPHLMFMGIGDVHFDTAPLQASQFEADSRIIDQLTDLWIEHGGGGNSFESYNLPWYFAAMHTSIDCFERRGKKGYLFTIGDEQTPTPLEPHHIKHFIGDTPESDLANEELLTMVGRMYHVFHIMVAEGHHCKYSGDQVRSKWTRLIGQRALWLADHTKLAEVVVSAIEVNEGRDRDAVAASWTGDTSMVVREALSGMTKAADDNPEVTRF